MLGLGGIYRGFGLPCRYWLGKHLDAVQGIIYQLWEMANPDEKWKELCAKAAVEKDPQRLLELVREINRIFEEQNEQRGTTDGGKTQ